jgi:hypothetical protein
VRHRGERERGHRDVERRVQPGHPAAELDHLGTQPSTEDEDPRGEEEGTAGSEHVEHDPPHPRPARHETKQGAGHPDEGADERPEEEHIAHREGRHRLRADELVPGPGHVAHAPARTRRRERRPAETGAPVEPVDRAHGTPGAEAGDADEQTVAHGPSAREPQRQPQRVEPDDHGEDERSTAEGAPVEPHGDESAASVDC